LIRERKREIFGLPGPKLESRSRIPVTNPANFLEAVSGQPPVSRRHTKIGLGFNHPSTRILPNTFLHGDRDAMVQKRAA
jgi:hypothetical protein